MFLPVTTWGFVTLDTTPSGRSLDFCTLPGNMSAKRAMLPELDSCFPSKKAFGGHHLGALLLGIDGLLLQ